MAFATYFTDHRARTLPSQILVPRMASLGLNVAQQALAGADEEVENES